MATYRDAGVDLDAAERAIERISDSVRSTWTEAVVGTFGGFATGISIPPGYESPVLMLSTDGVGTKAELGRRTGRLEGLGYDLVAMCADDLAAAGAKPIAMTDYVAVGRLDEGLVATLVDSVARACAEAGIALLGGETAEHPGVMATDQFDIAGTALGVVERGNDVDGATIVAGDLIVGIASPNLRSNGFSLVRAAVAAGLDLDARSGENRTVAETLMEPSVIYSPAISKVLSATRPKGMAHITGSGLPGNVTRILPESTAAVIDANAWLRPPIFGIVAESAGTPDIEMYRTFNMGIGFVVVVDPDDAALVTRILGDAGHQAVEIGEIVKGRRTVEVLGAS